jgi:hypothetical protein
VGAGGDAGLQYPPGCFGGSIGWFHGLANPQVPAFQNGVSVVGLF